MAKTSHLVRFAHTMLTTDLPKDVIRQRNGVLATVNTVPQPWDKPDHGPITTPRTIKTKVYDPSYKYHLEQLALQEDKPLEIETRTSVEIERDRLAELLKNWRGDINTPTWKKVHGQWESCNKAVSRQKKEDLDNKLKIEARKNKSRQQEPDYLSLFTKEEN